MVGEILIAMARTKNPNGRKRKKTLYMPDKLIKPLETEAKRIDRTVSWVVSECVRSAMPKIRELEQDAAE